MNKTKIIWILALLITIIPFSNNADAGIFDFLNSKDSGDIGYTYNGTQTHIWNQGNIKQDYYYNGDCNHQLSNLPDEIWEEVTLGLTYGDTKEDLINNYVELHSGGCNRIEQTDNETYVNITVWKSVSYLGKTGIIAKNSYIELNDDYMKETFYFKSNDNINTDLWFILKRDNIDISNNNKSDYIEVYNLDGTREYLNLTYADENNLTVIRDNTEIEQAIFLIDYETKEKILFQPNTTAEYKYIIHDDKLFTAFKAGTFNVGQSKTLETYWVDAGGCLCQLGWLDTDVTISNNAGIYYEGASQNVSMRIDYSGAQCGGGIVQLEDNSSGSSVLIPTADANDLDCSELGCRENSPSDGIWYHRNIDMENVGKYYIQAHWVCTNGVTEERWSPSIKINVTQNINPTLESEPDNPLIMGNYNVSNINVPNSDSINITGNKMTMAFDIYMIFDETIQSNNWIMDKRGAGANVNSYRAFFLNSIDDFRFRLTTATGTTNCDTTGLLWEKDTWYNVIYEYNSTHMNIWWNGTLEASCAKTGNIVGSPYDLYIAGSVNSFAGAIDNVRINNNSITPIEIGQLVNNTRNTNYTIFTDNQVLYLSMDEATGSTTEDSSAFGNDATIPSDKWWEGLVPDLGLCDTSYTGIGNWLITGNTECNSSNYNGENIGGNVIINDAVYFYENGVVINQSETYVKMVNNTGGVLVVS